MELIIKQGDASVKNFIFSSWIKCYLGTVEAHLMEKQKAIKFIHDFITQAFDSGVQVSYVGDDETEEVYSYVVYDDKRLLFGYTKSVYRGDKLFHRLMTENKLSGKDFCFIFNGGITREIASKYNLTYRPIGR